MSNVKEQAINAIRILSAEAIEKAKSGHPGITLGAAPIGYSLFQNAMKYSPANPDFVDRDRFVLSAGHGSMLYYSLLYLFGFGLKMSDIQNFRQLGSKTPGHPEYGVTKGVETSTGPLGQGIANAVGMAVAESHLAAIFNRDGYNVVDHYTYALCGDGCMQEGIENEAASFAGTNKLGKLIVIYDKNDITIEGNINSTFTEDVGKRHEALGWQVINVADANNISAISRAIKKAKAEKNKPSLIICKSVIGYGCPVAGSESTHGAPLGAENIKALRENLNWTAEPFTVPTNILRHTRRAVSRGKNIEKQWNELFENYKKAYPELAEKFLSYIENKIPDLENIEELWAFEKADATRGTSSTVLNKLEKLVPTLMGGSADLGPSNKSIMKAREYYSADNYAGSNMHYGIREQAMAAIANGMYLHGGVMPYVATFFVFTDYMRSSMRLSALMKLPVTYILTHDSIGVGEDGPTHQPVEHLVSLRSIPNMKVFRPADGKETAAAWISALSEKQPTCLILSRQNLPMYENTSKQALKGGYVLSDCEGKPELILIASGSEMEITVKASEILKAEGVKVRVVSMPCMELFERQTKAYKESVLPSSVTARVCIEASSPMSWYKYAGLNGEIIGINTFGESAPAKVLFEKFGFTVENVVAKAHKVLGK